MNRAVLTISKQKCRATLNHIKTTLNPSTKVMAVVKANAYGCGVDRIASFLKESGVDYFAVTTVEEACDVALYAPKVPILLLSQPMMQDVSALPLNVELTVYTPEFIRSLLEATPNRNWRVHLKINTGLNRLGIKPAGLEQLWAQIQSEATLQCVGLMTHLVESENANSEKTRSQIHAFESIVTKYRQINPRFIAHIANSAALEIRPSIEMDMVRIGLEIYKDSLSLRANVVHIQSIEAGESVSYQQLYIAEKPGNIAVVSIGYADGIPSRTTGAQVLINHRLYKVVGRICMDMICVDLGSDTCEVGAIAILFDPTIKDAPSFLDWAKHTHQNPREFLCGLGSRVTREWGD